MTEELAEELPEERPEDSHEEGPATPRAAEQSGEEPHEQRDDAHLQDLPDGSGCTEIWEHLAERRADDD